MLRPSLVLLVATCASVGLPALAAPVAPLGARVLTPLDFQDVRLDGGPMRAQLDVVRAEYLRVPIDDLLRGFRRRHGLADPGVELGGWYGADVFHVFGQYLSGLARLYAATGDETCRAKLDALIAGWAECIEPDGWFFYSRTPNAPHYIYDKLVGGLVDAYVYAGNRAALRHLRTITSWAEASLGRGRGYAYNSGQGDTEWYTLTENLYRAYLVTGEERYREFGHVWEYRDYWDLYARGEEIFAARPDGGQTGAYHAYSHVNTLGGLGAGYLVTGDPWYLDGLRGAYEYLQRNEVYATGGYGPDEQLVPRDELIRRLTASHASFEVQCGSWAAFKMSKYLISLTGEARYGDWVERLALNGIGADLPMAADGSVYYYADYCLGGARKAYTVGPWPCCAGTRPMAVADYVDQLYYRGPDGLYVNLYAPSTVTFDAGGSRVGVVQRTAFPVRDVTELTVDPSRPARFCLSFRVPGWLAGPMRVLVNDKPFDQTRVEGGWLRLERQWRAGDRVAVKLPMGLWTSSLDPGKPYPAAVLYGPTVLAFRSSDPDPLTAIDLEHIGDQLEPVRGDPLTFRLRARPDVIARPLSAFGEGEAYYLYLAPEMPFWLHVADLAYGGNWPVNTGSFRATPEVGASVEAGFTGTGVTWYGRRFDDAGIAVVAIDGTEVARVDQYAPGRDLPFTWESPTLPPGPHTIRLTVGAERNPASIGNYINLSGLIVLRGRQH